MNTADILCYESKKGNFSLDDKLQTVVPRNDLSSNSIKYKETLEVLKFTQKCYFVDVVPAENDNNIVIVVVFF